MNNRWRRRRQQQQRNIKEKRIRGFLILTGSGNHHNIFVYMLTLFVWPLSMVKNIVVSRDDDGDDGDDFSDKQQQQKKTKLFYYHSFLAILIYIT